MEINVQDKFLNKARRAGWIVNLHLLNGEIKVGLVQSYDTFNIMFLSPSASGPELIYKQDVVKIEKM